MPPVVIDLRKAEDVRDVVHQAVQALVEGKLVAFPTELSVQGDGGVSEAVRKRPEGAFYRGRKCS